MKKALRRRDISSEFCSEMLNRKYSDSWVIRSYSFRLLPYSVFSKQDCSFDSFENLVTCSNIVFRRWNEPSLYIQRLRSNSCMTGSDFQCFRVREPFPLPPPPPRKKRVSPKCDYASGSSAKIPSQAALVTEESSSLRDYLLMVLLGAWNILSNFQPLSNANKIRQKHSSPLETVVPWEEFCMVIGLFWGCACWRVMSALGQNLPVCELWSLSSNCKDGCRERIQRYSVFIWCRWHCYSCQISKLNMTFCFFRAKV